MGEKETAGASDAAARSGTLNVSASPGGSAALLADSGAGGAGTPPSTETTIIKSKSNITNNRGEEE